MPALRLLPPASCRRAFSHLERDSALSPPTPTLPAALSSWGSHFGLSPQGSSLPALKTSCASGALVFLTCKLCDLGQVTGSLWASVSLFVHFQNKVNNVCPSGFSLLHVHSAVVLDTDPPGCFSRASVFHGRCCQRGREGGGRWGSLPGPLLASGHECHRRAALGVAAAATVAALWGPLRFPTALRDIVNRGFVWTAPWSPRQTLFLHPRMLKVKR